MLKFIWDLFFPRYESPYSTAPELQAQIDANNYEDSVCVVNLGIESYRNNFRHKYLIKIEPVLPPDCNMCILFPHHPKQKEQRMFLRHYGPRALQKEINRRLKECPAAKMIFCVACADRVYRFEDIGGTVYLVWAGKVSQESRNQVEHEISSNLPVLIEMDGRGRYRSCFMFPLQRSEQSKRMQSLSVSDCTFLEPFVETLFCLEADPRTEELHTIHVMTDEEADKRASTLLSSLAFSKDREQVPYPSDDDE